MCPDAVGRALLSLAVGTSFKGSWKCGLAVVMRTNTKYGWSTIWGEETLLVEIPRSSGIEQAAAGPLKHLFHAVSYHGTPAPSLPDGTFRDSRFVGKRAAPSRCPAPRKLDMQGRAALQGSCISELDAVRTPVPAATVHAANSRACCD